MKISLKESIAFIALASFFALQGFLAGKNLVNFNFSMPYELGWKLGAAALIFGFFGTLIQRSNLEALKGVIFIGICFAISAAFTLLSASIHQTLDKAIGVSVAVIMFGAGISLGAIVKFTFKFRIDIGGVV